MCLSRRPDVNLLEANHDVAGLARALTFRRYSQKLDHQAIRLHAAEVLVRLLAAPQPGYVAAIVKMLKDGRLGRIGRHDVREAAVIALGKLDATRYQAGAVRQLLRAIDDKAWHVRRAAVVALGNLRITAASGRLCRALKEWDRYLLEVIEALGKIGDPAAIPPLVEILAGSDKRLARTAITALGGIQDDRIVKPLLAALPDPDLRQAAILALGEIRDPRAVEPLISFLDQTDTETRQLATLALGKIGDSRAVAPLAGALQTWEVERASAGEALAMIGGEAVTKLMELMDDPNPAVRATAARSLGAINNSRSVQRLCAASDDPEESVRKNAALALEAIGRRNVEALFNPLHSHTAPVRQAAIAALSQVGHPRAFTPLITTLLERPVPLTAPLVEFLSASHDSRAVMILLPGLHHPDQKVREATAHALANLGAPAVKPLLAELEQAPFGQRLYAVKALMELDRHHKLSPEQKRSLANFSADKSAN